MAIRKLLKMLKVQEFLLHNSLDKLVEEYAIKAVEHPDLPLIILNYDQINSPKLSTITRECRGLVLEKYTWKLIARGFYRFLNYGESKQEDATFNFGNFSCTSKEDGSLILIYYYSGWRINTRATFADEEWVKWTLRALNINSIRELNLCTKYTYVCELCSLHNKVVREYPRSTLFFLTAFQGEIERTLTYDHGLPTNFARPYTFHFSSIQEVQEFCQNQGDKTFEGVVLKDNEGRRLKVKNPAYLSLHKIKANNNIYLPKYLLPYILKGEIDEILTYFGELREACEKLSDHVNNLYKDLENLWLRVRHISDQKEFALSIAHHPLSCILFNTRKSHGELKDEWLKSGDIIIKHV